MHTDYVAMDDCMCTFMTIPGAFSSIHILHKMKKCTFSLTYMRGNDRNWFEFQHQWLVNHNQLMIDYNQFATFAIIYKSMATVKLDTFCKSYIYMCVCTMCYYPTLFAYFICLFHVTGRLQKITYLQSITLLNLQFTCQHLYCKCVCLAYSINIGYNRCVFTGLNTCVFMETML